MTVVRERETLAGDPATAAVPRDQGVQDAPAPLPVRRSGGTGAGERDLIAALLVHGYGRRPGDLGAVLAGLAETKY